MTEEDIADIQGNVIPGFNTDCQLFIALTVVEGQHAKTAAWLSGLPVTTAEQVRSRRASIRSATSQTETWLCVAVGFGFLRLALPDVWIRDEAFVRGMAARAPSRLGDTTPAAEWTLGPTRRPLDVLLIVAGNERRAVETRGSALVAEALEAGAEESYRELGTRIPGEREHFGFRDGISQPTVEGWEPQGQVKPGHFLIGHPRVAGGPPFAPVQDDRNITRNGSLLVIRRLEQDVAALRRFSRAEAQRLQASWPGLTPEHVEALMVGRWPSGAPIAAGQTGDPQQARPDDAFDFSADPDGVNCPFGAHIRKVNPRKGPRDVVDVPRMLRRGIPFGPLFEAEPASKRGLMFVAFQSEIPTRFEFITFNWMNSDIRPRQGSDLLVGKSTQRRLTVQGPNGPVTIEASLQDWIRPTGGAYLFAPGRKGLALFGQGAPKLALWPLKQAAVRTIDVVRESLTHLVR